MFRNYYILSLSLSYTLLHAATDIDSRFAELEKKINEIRVENTRHTYGAKNADNLPVLRDPKNFSLGIGLNYQKIFLTNNSYGYMSQGVERIQGSNRNSKDFLYNDAAFYTQEINDQTFNSNSESLNLDYSGSGSIIKSSFDWDLGINANIGYKTSLDGVNIKLSFSHYKTSSSNTSNSKNNQLVYFGTPFTGITGPAYFDPIQYFNHASQRHDFADKFYYQDALSSVQPSYHDGIDSSSYTKGRVLNALNYTRSNALNSLSYYRGTFIQSTVPTYNSFVQSLSFTPNSYNVVTSVSPSYKNFITSYVTSPSLSFAYDSAVSQLNTQTSNITNTAITTNPSNAITGLSSTSGFALNGVTTGDSSFLDNLNYSYGSYINSLNPYYHSFVDGIGSSSVNLMGSYDVSEAIRSLYPRQVQRFTINPETSNVIPVNKLKIDSNFDYNLVALELAKAYFISSKVSIETSLGLLSGWFNSKTRLTFSQGREFSSFSTILEKTEDPDVGNRFFAPPQYVLETGDFDDLFDQFYYFTSPETYLYSPAQSTLSNFLETNWGPESLKFEFESEFWGIGPQFAFESKIDLPKSFGLFLDTELAILYGKIKSNNTQTWTGAYPFVRAAEASWYAFDYSVDAYNYYAPPKEPLVEHEDGIKYKLYSSSRNFAPYMHLNLGLSWDWTSKDQKNNVIIKVGYDGQYIAQVIEKIDVDGASLSSIGTNGINANLTWSF